MLAVERYDIILKMIEDKGKVTVPELIEKLGVSSETIRRDLIVLNKKNKLKKVHGGAVIADSSIYEPSYNDRTRINIKAKERIGMLAASYIKDFDVIEIDVGTTALEVAKHINGVSEIKVITNSIPALYILIQKRDKGDFTGEIIFIGGSVDSHRLMTAGPSLMEQLKTLSFDKVFLGVTGLSEAGPMTYNIDEGYVQKMLVENANEVFALMDSSKVQKRSLYKYCDLNQVHYLITDDCELPQNIKKLLEEHNIKWIK
ncbi:MAG: DeoR/GlpR family DNA-binding transcription regulator [Anaerocolumna sp.]